MVEWVLERGDLEWDKDRERRFVMKEKTLSNVIRSFAILLSIAGQWSTIASYSTLIAEHPIPLNPLEEKTIHTMIQPRPPPANLAADFELYQCVEAFYNGV
ncbi:uncharacterized protein A4U43_C10F15290 [Asparagus officinalis]|uniref:Uncharacterized protein n=1 Tax=Asparagus officinalis TaxID=4686 RepID=A0A5P1E375_ASPOF|nr:uncharacterized protein A4U43_C10F15290 [Asparagus officinalis]